MVNNTIIKSQDAIFIEKWLSDHSFKDNWYYVVLNDIPCYNKDDIYIIPKGSIIKFDCVCITNQYIIETTNSNKCLEYKVISDENTKNICAYIKECREPYENSIESCYGIMNMYGADIGYLPLENDIIAANIKPIPNNFIEKLKNSISISNQKCIEIEKSNRTKNIKTCIKPLYILIPILIACIYITVKSIATAPSELTSITWFFISILVFFITVTIPIYIYDKCEEKSYANLINIRRNEQYISYHQFFEDCQQLFTKNTYDKTA